jgi:hypothetical protein
MRLKVECGVRRARGVFSVAAKCVGVCILFAGWVCGMNQTGENFFAMDVPPGTAWALERRAFSDAYEATRPEPVIGPSCHYSLLPACTRSLDTCLLSGSGPGADPTRSDGRWRVCSCYDAHTRCYKAAGCPDLPRAITTFCVEEMLCRKSACGAGALPAVASAVGAALFVAALAALVH